MADNKRTGLSALADAGNDGEDFSVIDAIGGPRGVIESMLPGVVFVVLFVATSNLNLTIAVSAVLAVLQVIVRLIQRQSVMGAVSGLVAVGICLIWAWQTHEARNYYIFGFITNAGYAALLAVSLIARVPGLGLVVEFIRSLPTEHFKAWFHDWMDDKALKRAYMIVTGLWVGLFLLRLVVQVPLYLTNHVAALGVTRLLMGIPFWALAIWVSYLIIATPMHRHKVAARKIQTEVAVDAELDRCWTGEVVEVLEPSEDRVTPAWPLAGPLAMGGGVGGADLVHVSLPGQLKWKAITVSEQMSRLGHIDVAVPIERMPGDKAAGGLNWRTRIEMIADDNGMPSMRRRGTHNRVAIDTMPLATRTLLDVAKREHVWEGGFEPGSQIRLSVPEPRGEIVDTAAADDNYAVLVDGELRAGSQLLTEQVTINGTTFDYQVDANGFWQVHRQAPIALGTHVINLVNGQLQSAADAVIWDLYSGSGLFTLPLATMTGERTRMLSVEGARVAVKNAQRNLRAMNLNDVDARAGDVSRTLDHVPAHLAKPNVVVLDPPRAGARAKVCRQIAAAGASSVVYIACDPTSLARDTATLIGEGYELKDIRAFDIYPMTHHVETVALFTR